MDLNPLKNNIPNGSTSVWDIFELDSFNQGLGLSVDGVTTILDKFRGILEVPSLDLQAMITKYLYIHMGGTEDTPTTEVIAFMFVLLNSPNFRFLEFNTMMTHAIYVDNTLRYLSELELSAPPSFIQSMYDSVGNPAVNNILNARYTITLANGMNPEEIENFTNDIHNNLVEYYSGGSALDAFPDIFSKN